LLVKEEDSIKVHEALQKNAFRGTTCKGFVDILPDKAGS